MVAAEVGPFLSITAKRLTGTPVVYQNAACATAQTPLDNKNLSQLSVTRDAYNINRLEGAAINP